MTPVPEPVESLVEVAVVLPLYETFTYRDPRGGTPILPGTQVVVPFGARRVTGFVVGAARETGRKVRDLDEVVDGDPALGEDIIELCRWAAAYYWAPLGEVFRAALPQGERVRAGKRARLTEDGRRVAGCEREDGEGDARALLPDLVLSETERGVLVRLGAAGTLSVKVLQRTLGEKNLARLADKGFVELGDEVKGPAQPRKRRDIWSVAQSAVAASVAPPALNEHQAHAFNQLHAALGHGYAAFVLQGITGSGKTEVYLRLISEARREGKGALVMVPEIALTPQLAARFRARFGDDLAVLHSGLPPAARRAAWRRLKDGEVGIALGARSAVFAPVRSLGVVVIDEEHDGSFKQEDGVRYHGRDLAIVRAQKAGAVVIMGSATPSLETFHNVQKGRYARLMLPTRANPAAAARPLPPVEIVDLRRHQPEADGIFSPRLAGAIAETLAAGEQTILFLNRRGFSPVILCRACGETLRCSGCSVSMTYHQGTNRLVCHYCARTIAPPSVCPGCGKADLDRIGVGTEQVESVLRARFPVARIARLDRDTAGPGSAGGLERVLAKVERGEVDILVGTQMVTKGHDFMGVTLVGVLLPDQAMHLPDFRAAERTFQILEQVAGRAGRGERPGKVIVQTYCPDHPAIAALRTHDYEGFVRGELARRHEAHYPPFSRMMVLRLDGQDGKSVEAAAFELASRARAAGREGALRILGPSPAPIAMLRGRSRWQVWLAAADRNQLSAAVVAVRQVVLPQAVRMAIDVDPQSVL